MWRDQLIFQRFMSEMIVSWTRVVACTGREMIRVKSYFKELDN